MSNERFDSVWDAIEDTPGQAENMRLRSSLMMALKNHILREGLSQGQAAKLFNITQPRVSDLMRGKIELFGLDGLVNMLATAGSRVEMHIRPAADNDTEAASSLLAVSSVEEGSGAMRRGKRKAMARAFTR